MLLKYKTVIFDLDGTLAESAPGVVASAKHALAVMGLPYPAELPDNTLIGPPLRYSFQHSLGVGADRLEEAIGLYRVRYADLGIREAKLYPGVEELLAGLRAAGACICLATSKYSVMTEIMLDHFQIRHFFDYLSMSDGTEMVSSKKKLLQNVLEATATPPEKAVMIGDTRFDAEGARETGVPFIGVLYGYGSRREMEEQGGRVFANSVPDLGNLLL